MQIKITNQFSSIRKAKVRSFVSSIFGESVIKGTLMYYTTTRPDLVKIGNWAILHNVKI